MDFELKEEHKTGIPEIDEQHQNLLNQIKQMYQAQLSNKIEELKNLIIDFEQQSYIHFDTEETLMEKFNYPKFNIHKNEHNNFKKTGVEIKSVMEKMNFDSSYLNKILNLLISWIYQHIEEQDLQFAEFVKNK